ncbi:MAG: M20 family metallopeptidase [Actinomycetota bacterium]
MEEIRTAVLRRIEELADETVELTREMVRIDSRNPTLPGIDRAEVIGGETRVNDLLEERYRAAGLETARVAADPERSNLVGTRRGTGGGRSLALNGHVDTVSPVEPSAWVTGDPWDPQIIDGRLYGIGSTDMKGSGAAMWAVAQALDDCGVRLQGDLQLHAVVGEEMMEHEVGTGAVIRAGHRTDAAIVTEPSSIPLPLSVNSVAPSALVFTVAIVGKATHCGNRPLALRPGGPGASIGVNAVERIIPLLQALQELERQWAVDMRHPGFPHGWFTIGPNVLHADAGMPFPASLADRGRIEYVAWHSPGIDPAEVQQAIRDQVHHAAQLDPWLREHPPEVAFHLSWPGYEQPWDAPITQTMVAAHAAASGSRQPDPTPDHPSNFGAACDATFYQAEGIPAIVYGPGELRIAHGIDEHVRVGELTLSAQALALAVLDWCGTDD